MTSASLHLHYPWWMCGEHVKIVAAHKALGAYDSCGEGDGQMCGEKIVFDVYLNKMYSHFHFLMRMVFSPFMMKWHRKM